MSGEDDMQIAASKLTYDDFVCFPDDGQRHELIDGRHYVTPSPATRHQRVSRDLLIALGLYFRTARIGEVFAAPFDVVLSCYDVVEPDLLVVLDDQRELVTAKHVRGAPAIVVEILSPGTRRRDEGIKRRLYERTGVREYWVVDCDRDVVAVNRRDGEGRLAAAEVRTVGDGHGLTSSLLPGFQLALAEIFVRP